jgi:hypothetical protein
MPREKYTHGAEMLVATGEAQMNDIHMRIIKETLGAKRKKIPADHGRALLYLIKNSRECA